MDPGPDIKLSNRELINLRNLSNIKEDQIVDIKKDGTVSAPYSIRGYTSCLWRTCQSFISCENNIYKIQTLMQRTVTNCTYSDCNKLKISLVNAKNGLIHLMDSYINLKDFETSKTILSIINYVKNSIKIFLRLQKTTSLTNEGYCTLNSLENSHEDVDKAETRKGTHGAYESVTYYRDRIRLFLLLEENQLKKEEIDFLNILESSLDSTQEIAAINITEAAHDLRLVLLKKGISIEEATPQALQAAKDDFTSFILNKIDAMLPDAQSQIGIPIPMMFRWRNDASTVGHVFVLCLCKEINGTYTAIQANAREFALGEITGMNWHSMTLSSDNIIPIVEFGPLTPEEATNFILLANENCKKQFNDFNEANNQYNKLFENLQNKRRNNRVPARRGQVVGNCGVRSLKEYIIFTFQKAGKIDLANRFLTYVDIRGSNDPSFEMVVPLKQINQEAKS